MRIALANIRIPATPDESVQLATAAVADAGRQLAAVICFPECFVPGYRWPGADAPPPDAAFLERAWAAVADAAKSARVTVILGTERITDRGLQISACVFNPDGTVAGWQDKGQIDPSEETTYPALATERRVFTAGPLTFGIVICHEGWRYPETVRWAARRGAQIVFHPHAHVADPAAIARARSAIRPTPSTKKPCSAARRRTPATSRRSTARAKARARRRRSLVRTAP